VVPLKKYLNPHLHERVSEHRDQKYFGEVSVLEISHQTGNALFGCNFLFNAVKTVLEQEILKNQVNRVVYAQNRS
jgi:hypothetical protein